MGQRTNVDFSRHEVTEIKYDGVLIHHFKRPETINCMLTFINTCGVMTVTGDFGNWVFCREFHPSANNESGVSGGYWDEKLEILSVQKASQYNAEETLKEIEQFKEDFSDNYGREINEEEKEWIESLEQSVDDEFHYAHIAYRENPSSIEYENVPFGKKRHFWLDAVYDGFDALCQALKKKETEIITNQKNIPLC
jgi:hypothetical protein